MARPTIERLTQELWDLLARRGVAKNENGIWLPVKYGNDVAQELRTLLENGNQTAADLIQLYRFVDALVTCERRVIQSQLF